MHDPRFGFVPPGHQAIMGFRVLHAWHHPSGAWLSIQAIGRSVALLWRSADSWKATVCIAAVFDECATFEENYDAAFRSGEFYIQEGPPTALLESAAKSAQVRKEKASNAAAERWKKAGNPQSYKANDKDLLKSGPNVDRRVWAWSKVDERAWLLRMTGTDIVLDLDKLDDGQYKLADGYACETMLAAASLRECFAAMEAISKNDRQYWEGEAE